MSHRDPDFWAIICEPVPKEFRVCLHSKATPLDLVSVGLGDEKGWLPVGDTYMLGLEVGYFEKLFGFRPKPWVWYPVWVETN